jgi:plastocyanin
LLAGGSAAPGEPVSHGTGTIEGEVLYEGTVPTPTIVMEGGRTQHVLYLGPNGGLRFAVGYLQAATEGPGDDLEPATLNQSGFIFEPQVLAVREGQPVRFTNEDGANHNVRSEPRDMRNRFSLYTGAGQSQTRRFRAEPDHRPIAITCDIHPWMMAWIYSFAHPHFAVTDAAGRFRIEGVRPGLHQLSVRHPAGGLQRDLRVRVTRGQVASVKVRFTSGELPASDTAGPWPAARRGRLHRAETPARQEPGTAHGRARPTPRR